MSSLRQKVGIWPDWCVQGEYPRYGIQLFDWIPEAVSQLEEAKKLFPEARVRLVSKEELAEMVMRIGD
jgi:hypothetical protein